MTTLAMMRSRLRREDLRPVAAGVALGLWALLAFATSFGVRLFPLARLPVVLLPLVLTVLAVRARTLRSGLSLAAGFAWLVIAAIVIAPKLDGSPKLALAFPAVAVAGVFASRFPAVCMVGVVFVAGTYGTLDAYTGFHNATFADAFIVGLWAAALGAAVFGHRRLAVRLTPALVLVAAYVAITLAGMLMTDPLEMGIRGFRLSTLHISVLLVIGAAAWRATTLAGVARAVAVVCTLVGAYATLRYFTGPTAKESAVNHSDEFFTMYNQIHEGEDKVQGSLPNGQQLGVWMACAIPFLAAMALSWRGPLRLVALVGLPLSLIGLLGSGQRTGFAAVLAGCLAIVIVRVASRGFRGPRFAVALGAVIGLLVAASVVYPAIVDKPEERARYANILSPSQDVPFQERLVKWRSVLDELGGHPFGFGLGAGNAEAIPRRFMDIAAYNIDNSYLMLAYGQGIPIALFFIVALLVLLAELLRHAVWTRASGGSVYATAAAGTLVAMMIEMFGANHVDSPAIMGGWVIVGLGVAQYAVQRAPGEDADRALA